MKALHILLPVAIAATLAIQPMAKDLEVEEIIVTAQKREQSTNDIPATVNAITGGTIRDYNLLEFKDLELVTSGLTLHSINARNARVGIRAVTSNPEAGSQAAVDVYVNGVTQRNDFAFSNMFDMERVEVLRGPQGTFQGRTSPGGSIQMHTKKPNLEEYEGFIQSQFGDLSTQNVQFGISYPIVEDVVAVRFALSQDGNDQSEVMNFTTGTTQDRETTSYRLSLLYQPTYEIDISFVYSNIDRETADARVIVGNRTSATFSTASGYTTGVCDQAAGTVTFTIPNTNTPDDPDDTLVMSRDATPEVLATCRQFSADDNLAAAPLDDFSNYQADSMSINFSWEFDDYRLLYTFGSSDSEKMGRSENDWTSNIVAQNFVIKQFTLAAHPSYSFSPNLRTYQTTNTMVDQTVHEIRFESVDNLTWNYMFGVYMEDTKTSTPFLAWNAAARYTPLADTGAHGNALSRHIAAIAQDVNNPAVGNHIVTLNGGSVVGMNFSTGGTIPFNSETTGLFTHHSIDLDPWTVELGLRFLDVSRFNQTNIRYIGQHATDNYQFLHNTHAGNSATGGRDYSVYEADGNGDLVMVDNAPVAYTLPTTFVDGTTGYTAAVDAANAQADAIGATIPPTFVGTLQFFSNITGVPLKHQNIDEDAVTSLVAVRYNYYDDITLYGSWNRGFRSGGISIVPTGGFTIPSNLLLYNNETSDSFEFGLKANVYTGTINGAFFYQILNDHFGRVTSLEVDITALREAGGSAVVQGIQRPAGGIVFNGDAVIAGIEFEGQFLVRDDLLLGGGVALVSAEWDSAKEAPCNIRTSASPIIGKCDISGDRIAGEPEFSFNFNVEYTFPVGFMQGYVRGLYKHRGELLSTASPTYDSSGNIQKVKEVDALGILNLYLGLRGDYDTDWEVSLYIKNLTDASSETTLNLGSTYDPAAQFAQLYEQVPPMSIGISGRYNFSEY